MISQCAYCHRVKGADGEFHDLGFLANVNEFVVGIRAERVPVSHGICGECLREERRQLEEIHRLERIGGAPRASE